MQSKHKHNIHYKTTIQCMHAMNLHHTYNLITTLTDEVKQHDVPMMYSIIFLFPFFS